MGSTHVEDYDFVANRPPYKGTTLIEATGHLVKACLGAGILGIPEGYKITGLWTAVVFTVLFGAYITYCVHMLVTSAQVLYVRLKIPQMSYPDLAQKSLEAGPWPKFQNCGKFFRYAVDIIICVDLFGSCAVYEIIIAKTIYQLTHPDLIGDPPDNDLRLYILMVLLPIILLCMIRTLKYLAPFTLVADFFIVLCVIATVYYGLQKAPPISERPAFTDFMKFFEFCGMVVFSMEGVGVALPIENSMKEPKKYIIILVCGMSIVVGFVLITGFFGYWGFGEGTLSPVTLNFPHTTFPSVLKGFIGAMIYVTFGLNFWAPFNLVWYYLKKKHPEEKHYIWERIYRAITVTCITSIAVAFPRIGPLIGLLGSFCLSNMGFIFPAIIETAVLKSSYGYGAMNWLLIKNILIIILGTILCVSGTVSSAKSLLDL